jgi:predicted DNA-binding transcriptional regulator AlpA
MVANVFSSFSKILAYKVLDKELLTVHTLKFKGIVMTSFAPQTNIKGEPITLQDRFLSAKEVAEICGVGKATIYRSMDRNEFPLSHQLAVSRVGWLKSDIEEYVSLGFVNFFRQYGEKIKQQRIENKAALAALTATAA